MFNIDYKQELVTKVIVCRISYKIICHAKNQENLYKRKDNKQSPKLR